MINPKAVAAGVAAGAVGAAIWAAIAYFTGYEIGWIAWGIGAAVGGAMYAAAKQGSPQIAIAAVVITVLSICAGKYAAVEVTLSSAMEELGDWEAEYDDEEYLISFIADDLINSAEEAGERVTWPRGVDPTEAARESDYPPEYWAEAEAAWEGMSTQEREEFKNDLLAGHRAFMDALLSEASSAGFKESFGAMDFLFFGLAIVSAWRIGSLGGEG